MEDDEFIYATFTNNQVRVLIKALHMYAARAVLQTEADTASDLEALFIEMSS